MSVLSSGYNLPPGCFESDLPGNSSIEMAAEREVDSILREDLLDYVAETYVHDVLWFNEDKLVWEMENDDGDVIVAGASSEEAVEKFLNEREELVMDAMTERIYERFADGDY